MRTGYMLNFLEMALCNLVWFQMLVLKKCPLCKRALQLLKCIYTSLGCCQYFTRKGATAEVQEEP